jgi:hypothetical protein
MRNSQFKPLNHEDTISITHDAHVIASQLKTFQCKDLHQKLRELMRLTIEDHAGYQWLGDGIEARLLQASKSNMGWIDGNARICLTFQSDESELECIQPRVYIPKSKDVLEIKNEEARLVPRQNAIFSEMIYHIRQKINLTDPGQSRYYWIDRGIECEVLKSSGEVSGWQSGLIRLQLEFIPTAAHNIIEHAANSATGLDSLRQTALN